MPKVKPTKSENIQAEKSAEAAQPKPEILAKETAAETAKPEPVKPHPKAEEPKAAAKPRKVSKEEAVKIAKNPKRYLFLL